MNKQTKPKPKKKKTASKDATNLYAKFRGDHLSWVAFALVIVGVTILVYTSGFKLEDAEKGSQKSKIEQAGGTPTIGGHGYSVSPDLR